MTRGDPMGAMANLKQGTRQVLVNFPHRLLLLMSTAAKERESRPLLAPTVHKKPQPEHMGSALEAWYRAILSVVPSSAWEDQISACIDE